MRLRILFLITLLFALTLGCNKVNDLATNETDQNVNAALKTTWTPYSGVSDPVDGGYFYPGEWTFLPNGNVKIQGMVVEWYDTADEPLLTGTSMWYENWLFNPDDPKVKFWGTATIEVEGGEGVWQGSWHGFGSFLGDPPYDFWESDLEGAIDVVFTGHGGEIQGMVAKVHYTINTSVLFQWAFEGEYKDK